MKNEVQYRPAKSQDAKAMVNIHYKAVHAIPKTFYSQAVISAWSPRPDKNRIDWLQAMIQNGNSCCFVAEQEEKLIGFAIVLLAEKKLQAIYVNPKAKGKGVGYELMAKVESAAAQKGVKSLTLKASINALKFYQNIGYKEKGEKGETAQLLSNGLKMEAIKMVKTLTA